VRRRLELLVTAVYDRPIPITVAEASRRRPLSLVRRVFGGPRVVREGTLPATDGERIQLPREIESENADAALATYRLMAVEQAERIARGTAALVPAAATPIERDLYLMRESTAVDAAIARTVPGLRSVLAAARAVALSRRPPLGSLTAAERAVEQLLRRALDADPASSSAVAPGDASPAGSLAWARETAAWVSASGTRYRGVAPVPTWGVVTAPPNAGTAAPHRRADAPPTLQGGMHGIGQFGLGTGDGGEQASETGVEEGVPDDPRRAGEARLPHGSTDVAAPGGRGVPDDASPGGSLSLPPRGQELSEGPDDDGADPDAYPAPGAVAHERPVAVGTASGAQPRRRRPAPQPVGLGVEYPEWDWKTGDYRPAGAIVRPHEPALSDDRWGTQVLSRYGPLVRRLRERFERLRARRVRLGQQRDGDELDIAACVRALVDQRTGHAVDDRMYIAVRPARRGLAIALLIDISGSTDEWIDGRRRVIDVEKVALLVASEALDALGDLYAVLTFSGKGRANVRMRTIKDFAEPNGPLVRRRIAALEPEGYTRTGAAVRHAAALLARQPAAHRLLLMISDGKPNDVDGYEGLSGVEDTRQAIIEARDEGVYPFCLTIDRQGQEYLGRIFGEAGHTVLRNPQQLPIALVRVAKRLLAS